MTDPRKQAFLPYLRKLAAALALKDWTFTIDDIVSDPDCHASIMCTYGRKRAVVRLGDSFLDCIPADQRHYLVHELIHCHVEPAWMIALDAIPLDTQHAFRRMFEYGVDGLADAIAPLMPLPHAE